MISLKTNGKRALEAENQKLIETLRETQEAFLRLKNELDAHVCYLEHQAGAQYLGNRRYKRISTWNNSPVFVIGYKGEVRDS